MSVTPYALKMLFYFVDPRSLDEVQEVVARALGCSLAVRETDDRYDPDWRDGRVLGMDVSLMRASSWPEGNVFRLNGSTMNLSLPKDAAPLRMEGHVQFLLARYGINSFLEPSQYGTRDRALHPEQYAKEST